MKTSTAAWDKLTLNDHSLPYDLDEPPLTPGVTDYMFGFVYGGNANGTFRAEQARWRGCHLKFGMAVIVEPYQGVAWNWRSLNEEHGNIKAVTLFLSPDLFNSIAERDADIDSRCIEIPSKAGFFDELGGAVALGLKADAENGFPLGKLYGETAAQFLAVHILRNHGIIRYKQLRGAGKLARNHLNTVIEYINAHVDQEISLESLAELCGLSPYYFSRLFKQTVGMPPHQYLMYRRIEKAKHLLKHSTLSILEVAARVGYQNQGHFSSLFKCYCGVTPYEYRTKI